MNPRPRPEVGHAIARLGAAIVDGTIARSDAVAELREIDPTLSEQGANAQLNAYRSAVSRYARREAPTFRRPADARALRAREAIRFDFSKLAGAGPENS